MNTEVPKSPLPSKSWEIFSFARRVLGESGLYKVFHIEKTQIYRWARSPEIEESRRNPIDRVSKLLTEISICGGDEGREVALIALNLMSKDCGFKVVNTDPVKPTTDSPRAEFLELHNRLHELQAVAQNQDNPLVVEAYADKVKDSLSGFLVRYTVDFQEQGGKVRFSVKSNTARSFWANFWPFGR
ncbi:MAG: hypothetical protein BA863_05125 [Desulfovibrio sp. S3730MH75]|nr:MAG: hypothetical protein BA863_05125 [Desulfovibrio sp. S3730MH75]